MPYKFLSFLTVPIALIASGNTSHSQDFSSSKSTQQIKESSALIYKSKLKNTSKKKNSIVAMKSALSGYSRRDEKNSEDLAFFTNDIKLQSEMGPSFTTGAHLAVNFASGSTQGFRDQIERRQGLFVKEALAEFQVVESFDFSTGILRQRFNNPANFISGNSFPSLKESFSQSFSNFSYTATAQQSVVTSKQLNTRTSEKESTPYYIDFRLEGSTEQKDYVFGGLIGSFNFTSLPSQAAADGRLLGNSVLYDRSSNNRFAYEFAGYYTGLNGELWTFYPIVLRASWFYSENQRAPSGRNKSQTYSLQAAFNYNKDLDWKLSYLNYAMQSDAAPAYFTSSLLGNNNRNTNALRGSLVFKQHKMQAHLDFIDSQLIEPITSQFDERKIFLTLETNYVEF